MADYYAIKDALIACDVVKITGLVNSSLAKGVAAGDIMNNGLIAGIDIVGERMEYGSMLFLKYSWPPGQWQAALPSQATTGR